MHTQQNRHTESFTLIELLIVIGVLAVLTAAVVLIMNPAERLKESRDARRITELTSLEKTINVLTTQNTNLPMGTSSVVYVSIPDDASSTCGSLGLPALSPGYTYNCVTTANLRKTNSTGWIPIDFSSTGVAMLPTLPIDPVNTTSTGLYYTYMMGGSFEVNAKFESQKYDDLMASDGGDSLVAYERGTSKSIIPAVSSGIAFNASSESGEWIWDGNAPKTFSWSHTVSSGSNRILIVTIVVGGHNIDSITYNGSALTSAGYSGSLDSPSFGMNMWYLIAPASGTHNIVVTLSGGMPFEGGATAFATDYTGVHQSSPIHTGVNEVGETNSFTITVTTSIPNTRGYSAVLSFLYGFSPSQYENVYQQGDIGTDVFFETADKIFTSTGAQSITWESGVAATVGGFLIALKPAS